MLSIYGKYPHGIYENIVDKQAQSWLYVNSNEELGTSAQVSFKLSSLSLSRTCEDEYISLAQGSRRYIPPTSNKKISIENDHEDD
jgi:hypothetical protein